MNKKYRKVIIAGNWKMNQLPSGVKPFVEELKTKLPAGMNGCSVVLCVPATHLAALAREKARAHRHRRAERLPSSIRARTPARSAWT